MQNDSFPKDVQRDKFSLTVPLTDYNHCNTNQIWGKKKGKKNQCFPVTPTNNDPSQLNHIRRRKTKSNLKSNWATSIIKTFKS